MTFGLGIVCYTNIWKYVGREACKVAVAALVQAAHSRSDVFRCCRGMAGQCSICPL